MTHFASAIEMAAVGLTIAATGGSAFILYIIFSPQLGRELEDEYRNRH